MPAVPAPMASRRYAVLLVVLTASVALWGGFLRVNQCVDESLQEHDYYQRYCYSDIRQLYFDRDLDEDAVPYVETFNEYPVLTGSLQWLTARLADDVVQFYTATALFLLAAGYAAVVAMWRLGPGLGRILSFTATPALLVHSFTNWDLVAVALALWGWVRWRQGDAFGSALLFGLGGAAKLFPAFFLPFLLVAAVRLRDWRRAGQVAAGGFLGLGVPNLVVIAWAPDGWWASWRFHAERGLNWETPWYWFGGKPGVAEAAGPAGALLMAAALGTLAVVQWRRSWDPMLAGTLLTGAFLLTTRVYSPQYTLWLLPLLVLAGCDLRALWGFLAADFAEYLLIMQWLTWPTERPSWLERDLDPWLFTAVGVRWVLLLLLVGGLARAEMRRRRRGEI